MSDFIEKILEEEQDTDKKFVDAASFFMSLKGKDKEAALASPAKGKKTKQLAAKQSKRVVVQGGGRPVPMKAAPIRKGAPVQGQAQLSDPRKAQNYKQIAQAAPALKKPKAKIVKGKKPKVTVKIGSAEAALVRLSEAGELNKQAYVVNVLRGLREVGEQAAKSGAKSIANTASSVKGQSKTFAEGYRAQPGNAFTNAWRNLTSRAAPKAEGFNSGVMANIPFVSTPARKARDLFRNPELVAKENAYRAKQKSWVAKQKRNQTLEGPLPAGQQRLTDDQIASQLTNMRQNQQKNLDMFRSGMDARALTGVPETQANILKGMRGPDGSYSLGSIMKGADQLGLFNPATIASLGLGVKGSMDAAKAARAAAQKDKMMKWGLGGAAGLGALALLKNSGSKDRA